MPKQSAIPGLRDAMKKKVTRREPEEQTAMIDATYLKTDRTATSV